MNNTSNMIVGCLEVVSFPEFGIDSVWAKIDTGAYSGALHCTDINVETNSSDHRVLTFKPHGDETRKVEVADFQETFARSATGHRVKRYIISTEIIIQGKRLPISIGLASRKNMARPVLIGRRFLRENKMIVDARINQQHDLDGLGSKRRSV